MAFQKKFYTAAEEFEFITKDCGVQVCAQDSSSEDEDLIFPDHHHDDDLDSEMSQIESDCDSDTDYEPPSPITTAQPSKGRAATRPTSSRPEMQQPERFVEKPPQQNVLKRKKQATSGHRKSPVEEPTVWHNKDEEDCSPESFRFTPAREPGPTFDRTVSWSPLTLFNLFFNVAAIRTIIENTNANADQKKKAGQKFKWTILTEKEFYVFLAIIVFTGLVNVHHRADFWKQHWPYNFQFPRESMSRNRFESILWSLHLSNPKDDEENDMKKGTPEYDRLFKIKPLYDQIVTACKNNFHPNKHICIDERMVASKARIGIKQSMKDKPTKLGYKLFVLADSATGYTWNFFVYTGKCESSTGQGLSFSSVVDLLPLSLLGGGYSLYIDDFYTIPALLQHLYKNRIGCCGTIRKNRLGFPRANINDFPKKAERGDVRWIRKENLLFVKWIDTREVTMCSTIHKAFDGQTVQRIVKEAGVWQTKAVPVPGAVLDYNKHMGGVDLSDALIGYYSVHHKTMKWYKTFFYHFVDIAITNSFLLWKQLGSSQPGSVSTYKSFREQLAKEMMEFAVGTSPSFTPAAPPTPTPTPTPCMPYYYGDDGSQGRRYCRWCQKAGNQRVKTPIYCGACNVPLCLTPKRNCFVLWHKKQQTKCK